MKIGTSGCVDLSLLALISTHEKGGVGCPPQRSGWAIDAELAPDELLRRVDDNQLQLAVVSLDHLFDHALHHPESRVRILGPLLGGDCRALVTLANRAHRTLGAAHPTAAYARWEDISCALDLECRYDRVEQVPLSAMTDAMMTSRHSILEMNLFWEGVMGHRRGLIRSTARPSEFGIPEGLSHVLISNSICVKKNASALRGLRDEISETYRNLLEDPKPICEMWSSCGIFPKHVDCSFLSASARVLGPHCEQFLRWGGKFQPTQIESHQRWFNSRVALPSSKDKICRAGADIQCLLCDLWQ